MEDLSKQINSASRLKVLAILINEHKQDHGEISAVTIKSIAEKESFQADLWGHEMAVLVRDDSFLIVYPGRDGKFDVDDISRYFNQDQVNVTGMYDHDLVVENRHLLTIVGKEVPEKFPKGPLIPGKLP